MLSYVVFPNDSFSIDAYFPVRLTRTFDGTPMPEQSIRRFVCLAVADSPYSRYSLKGLTAILFG